MNLLEKKTCAIYSYQINFAKSKSKHPYQVSYYLRCTPDETIYLTNLNI